MNVEELLFYFILVPRTLRDYIGENTPSNKQEISEEKAEKRNNPGKKYFILPDDSATLSLDLANDFPEAEESQIRNKEPTPKNI